MLLRQCREQLQKLPHGDLRFFTTPIAMQDLDAVRRALGAERINLVGASYGTRAGLDYLRQFPQAVRRLVLDGVAPPDMVLPASFSTDGQAAFDAMLARPSRLQQPPRPARRVGRVACAPAAARDGAAPAERRARELRADARDGLVGRARRLVFTGAGAGAAGGHPRGGAVAACRPCSRWAAGSRRARARRWRWACTSRWCAPKTCRAWP